MSCETVQTLLLEMAAALPDDAQAHVKGCADCAALAKEMSALRDLTAMPRPSPGSVAAPAARRLSDDP